MATTNNDGKTLVVLLGATATGKTDVGIALARAFGSEIVSSDSRQIYREMSIGTAKPTEEELSAVPHHLIGTHSVREDYSAGRYEQDALRVLEERFREHDTLFLVGGSGLYIDAVCYGMDELPAVDPHLRKTLVRRAQTEGLESLFEELRKLDPAHCEVMDRSNPQRVIRALEVCLQSGRPYSSLRKGEPKTRPVRILRVEYNALQTVGYRELFAYFEGETSRERAIELIKRNSRRYAKRQTTWFARNTDTRWFEAEEGCAEKIAGYLSGTI